MRPLKNKEMEGRGILHIKRGEGKGVAVRSESSCKSPPAELLARAPQGWLCLILQMRT